MLAVLTLLLTSCAVTSPQQPSGPEEPEKGISPDCFILIPDMFMETSVAYKINTKTGTYLPICPDPVCAHNSEDCVAYRVDKVRNRGNDLYFSKSYTVKQGQYGQRLYHMDMTTGEVEQVTFNDEAYDTLFSGGFATTEKRLIMYQNVYPDEILEAIKENNDPALGMIHFPDIHIHTYDPETKEIRSFGTVGDILGESDKYKSTKPSISNSDADTIKWCVGEKFYTTDYDMNVISVEDVQSKNDEPETGWAISRNGKHFLFVRNDGRHEGFGTLYSVDEETNEKTVLETDIARFMFDDETDSIIYMKYHKEPLVIMHKEEADTLMGENRDITEYCANEIFAMRSDGSEKRSLCKIEDPYLDHTAAEEFQNESNTVTNVNNWILVSLSHYYVKTVYDEKTEKTYTEPDLEYLGGYAMVNIVTGEYRVVYPNGVPSSNEERDLSAEIKKAS